jgi:hypothetical protein
MEGFGYLHGVIHCSESSLRFSLTILCGSTDLHVGKGKTLRFQMMKQGTIINALCCFGLVLVLAVLGFALAGQVLYHLNPNPSPFLL